MQYGGEAFNLRGVPWVDGLGSYESCFTRERQQRLTCAGTVLPMSEEDFSNVGLSVRVEAEGADEREGESVWEAKAGFLCCPAPAGGDSLAQRMRIIALHYSSVLAWKTGERHQFNDSATAPATSTMTLVLFRVQLLSIATICLSTATQQFQP